MAEHSLQNFDPDSTSPQKIGPNEEAILDQISIPALRHIAESIVRLKMRLQFTGWLQYILPLICAVATFLIAVLLRLLGIVQVANWFGMLGVLLLAVFCFDLITVKYKIRFHESLPKSNAHLDIFDLMRIRRSCRSFQTRKLAPEHLEKIMESVRIHTTEPTIGSAPMRFEYISAPLTVWPVVNATEFLVAIAPKQYNRLAVIDIGRSLQKIVMDATRMGLATCWIGPGADQSSIKKHLGNRFNPDQDHIVCVCAIGYKSSYIPLFIRIFNRQFKQRLPLSTLFFTGPQFEEPLDLDVPPFNRFGRTYEICQWAPSSYNGQTTRCVGVQESKASDASVRFDFYASTASRYYAPVALGIWCANWELGCEGLCIRGHFEILPHGGKRNQSEEAIVQLPHYDVSWISETVI